MLILRVIIEPHALVREDRVGEVLNEIVFRVTQVGEFLIVVTSHVWSSLRRQWEERLDIAAKEELTIVAAERWHWHWREDDIWLNFNWSGGLNGEFPWVTAVRLVEGVLGRAWGKSRAVQIIQRN